MQPGYNTPDMRSIGSSGALVDIQKIDWEGHLPREPFRHEHCSGLIHPGTMTTEVSHNVLTSLVISY